MDKCIFKIYTSKKNNRFFKADLSDSTDPTNRKT